MTIVRRGSRKETEETQPEVTPKPIKESAGIKKRIPAKDKLIYISKEGVLVVKTPAPCTYWPQDLRIRIVRDYVAPRTFMSLDAYVKRFVDTGGQDRVYKAGRYELRVLQPIEPLKPHHVVILRTEIVDVKTKRSMYLYHDDPAMRMLMTYAFLTQSEIPGMPKLEVYDYLP